MASNYNNSEMMSMQQDAIRRVREMQRRANENLRQSQQPMQQNLGQQEPIAGMRPPAAEQRQQSSGGNHTAPVQHAPAKQEQSKGLSLAFLDKLGIDQEKGVLLLLIVLLLNEGADTKLILALCYLLI